MMQSIIATPASASAEPKQSLRRVAIGERVHEAGAEGVAWRVASGAVRLDRVGAEGRSFAGLALRGDVIGAESMVFGRYSFEASAIGDCELEPWPPAGREVSGASLLQTLAATERRAADALALRAGEAFDRVRQLCLLLARDRADGRREVTIPGLKDMAEITGLTVETVSRAMSQLRKSGMLQRHGRRFGLILAERGQVAAI
jgi:CRP/FNR family nitrogen fixation transcriptional regulator